MTQALSVSEATEFATRALTGCGARRVVAESVARSVVAAQLRGRTNVGFEHLPYYCEALNRGAADGEAEPTLERTRPALLQADAHCGFTHYAFDRALGDFTSMAQKQGVALLTMRNTFTCGELGYFPERLARLGFVAIATTNAGPAAAAPSGTARPVFSTNPLAFAFPRKEKPPLLVDQSTSACTLVDIRAARDRGEEIPKGWALDSEGVPTTDPEKALQGSFRTFGGDKGSNIAMLVELLAAGLSGGNWSLDAPSFADSDESPRVGQWILAMHGGAFCEGRSAERIDTYLKRIDSMGAYIPGESRLKSTGSGREVIALPDNLYKKVQNYCSGQ